MTGHIIAVVAEFTNHIESTTLVKVSPHNNRLGLQPIFNLILYTVLYKLLTYY